MAVPYTFGSATTSIPLSQLDSNFATTITLGNTAVQLGNTVTTLNNMTLANITVSSGNVTATNVTATNVTSPLSTALTLQSNAGNTAVTIDTSQNVGIGTSSPTYKIQAEGSTPAYFGNDSTSGTRFGYALALPTNSTNCFVGWIPDSVGISGVNGDLALQPRTSAGANIRFFTGSTTATERMRIDSSGNLLVGCTSEPGGSTRGFAVYTNGGSASRRYLVNSVDTTGNFDHFYFFSGSGWAGYIRTNGTTTTYNSISDERLKENIVDAPSALGIVDAIKVRSFDWKSGDGHVDHGFIAQELNEVAPQAVADGEDKDDGQIKTPWAIDSSMLVPMLVKAIQELKAINDTQAETINALTARIVALEAK